MSFARTKAGKQRIRKRVKQARHSVDQKKLKLETARNKKGPNHSQLMHNEHTLIGEPGELLPGLSGPVSPLELLVAADRFGVEDLCHALVQGLCRRVTDGTVCELLCFAEACFKDNLADFCMMRIAARHRSISQTEAYKQINAETRSQIDLLRARLARPHGGTV